MQKIGFFQFAVVLAATAAAQAQTPTITEGRVENAASYVRGQPVAPGSLVSVFGTNFALETVSASSIPLPTEISGVTVRFNNIPAPLLFVSPGQINAQLPWSIPPGQATVVVTRGGVASQPGIFVVGNYSPGIFTLQYGPGQAIAINADGSLAAPSNLALEYPKRAAGPGETVVLLGTGLGTVSPPPVMGASSMDVLRSALRTPTVLIGGRPATVLYAGLSPEFVGVNQLNVVIPQGVTPGDAVPVRIMVGGSISREQVTMSISAPPAPAVPAEYRDLYNQVQADLLTFNNGVDAVWDGSKSATVRFSGECFPGDAVQSNLITGYYETRILPFLDAAQRIGIKAVKVQMGFPILYEPFFRDYLQAPQLYPQYVAFYKRLVADVRARGMKFISQAQHVDNSRGANLAGNNRGVREYYRTLTWDQYQAARSAFIMTVAREVNPDYLLMQTEAANEAANTGRNELLDVGRNTAMLSRFLSDLRASGLHTMIVGAGLGSWYNGWKEETNALARLQDLDLIDIHVYPINTQGGDNMGLRILEMADIARAAGKRAGISEAWLYKIRNSELTPTGPGPDEVYARDVFSFWESSDMLFLRAMTSFAHLKKLEYMNAAYDIYFFGYVNYEEAQAACGSTCTPGQLTRMLNEQAFEYLRNQRITESGRYYSSLIQ
jgi:uncharacterized protein (TIGR03437 family)